MRFPMRVAVLVSAAATSAAVQSRCVAQTIAAAPVTSGAANDVPTGGVATSEVCDTPSAPEAMTLMPYMGATRPTCGPRAGALQPGVRAPRPGPPPPSTAVGEAVNVFLAPEPSLPTSATTSAPESCS